LFLTLLLHNLPIFVFYLLNPHLIPRNLWRYATTKPGAKRFGIPLGLDNIPKVDIVIADSVAVSAQGARIGKGTGYGDLEYSMLRECGSIDDSTVVVTTVHDMQIVPTPEDLVNLVPIPGRIPPPIPGQYWTRFTPLMCLAPYIMLPHDLPVDIIVTPTQVFYTQTKIPKPPGVLWEKITYSLLQDIPILKVLQNRGSDGKEKSILLPVLPLSSLATSTSTTTSTSSLSYKSLSGSKKRRKKPRKQSKFDKSSAELQSKNIK